MKLWSSPLIQILISHVTTWLVSCLVSQSNVPLLASVDYLISVLNNETLPLLLASDGRLPLTTVQPLNINNASSVSIMNGYCDVSNSITCPDNSIVMQCQVANGGWRLMKFRFTTTNTNINMVVSTEALTELVQYRFSCIACSESRVVYSRWNFTSISSVITGIPPGAVDTFAVERPVEHIIWDIENMFFFVSGSSILWRSSLSVDDLSPSPKQFQVRRMDLILDLCTWEDKLIVVGREGSSSSLSMSIIEWASMEETSYSLDIGGSFTGMRVYNDHLILSSDEQSIFLRLGSLMFADGLNPLTLVRFDDYNATRTSPMLQVAFSFGSSNAEQYLWFRTATGLAVADISYYLYTYVDSQMWFEFLSGEEVKLTVPSLRQLVDCGGTRVGLVGSTADSLNDVALILDTKSRSKIRLLRLDLSGSYALACNLYDICIVSIHRSGALTLRSFLFKNRQVEERILTVGGCSVTKIVDHFLYGRDVFVIAFVSLCPTINTESVIINATDGNLFQFSFKVSSVSQSKNWWLLAGYDKSGSITSAISLVVDPQTGASSNLLTISGSKDVFGLFHINSFLVSHVCSLKFQGNPNLGSIGCDIGMTQILNGGSSYGESFLYGTVGNDLILRRSIGSFEFSGSNFTLFLSSAASSVELRLVDSFGYEVGFKSFTSPDSIVSIVDATFFTRELAYIVRYNSRLDGSSYDILKYVMAPSIPRPLITSPSTLFTGAAVNRLSFTSALSVVCTCSNEDTYYVVGHVSVSFPNYGAFRVGRNDILVSAFTMNSTVLWLRIIGSTQNDYVTACSAFKSGIAIVGYTHGQFPGYTLSGTYDLFATVLEANDGSSRWLKQWGTSDSYDYEMLNAVKATESSFFACGVVSGRLGTQYGGLGDGYLVSISVDSGTFLWHFQWGHSGWDTFNDLVITSDSIFLVGTTEATTMDGSTGTATSAVAIKVNLLGERIWTKLLGSDGDDFGTSISFFSDKLYVTATLRGSVFMDTPLNSRNLNDVALIMLQADSGLVNQFVILGISNTDLTRIYQYWSGSRLYLAGSTLRADDDSGTARGFVAEMDSSMQLKGFALSPLNGNHRILGLIGNYENFLCLMMTDSESILWLLQTGSFARQTGSATSSVESIETFFTTKEVLSPSKDPSYFPKEDRLRNIIVLSVSISVGALALIILLIVIFRSRRPKEESGSTDNLMDFQPSVSRKDQISLHGNIPKNI